MLNGKTILITGGTGSFGRNFTKYLLGHTSLKKIIIFSRDEYKQFHMKQELLDSENRLRYFIGDVRDLQRLYQAFNGVDIVIHAAALKQVPSVEYNPYEAVKTNIYGTQNVIEAAIYKNVSNVLLISSDKAVQPANLYGATKMCAEKLIVSANAYSPYKTRLSAVRYGNVVGSRGSIVETILKNGQVDKVSITHLDMTRFWISLEQSFESVMFALSNMEGGDIFVPKIPSMKILDLMEALLPEAEKEVTGIRPGEKLHEVLLTKEECRHSVEFDKHFVIIPEFNFAGRNFEKYLTTGSQVSEDFMFTSDTNKEWVTSEQIKTVIKELSI